MTKQRLLYLTAYLILTFGVILALNNVRNEGEVRRSEIALSAQRVARITCQRQNITRTQLRFIIKKGIPPIKGYVKRGLLTKAEGDQIIRSSRASIKKLHSLPCADIVIAGAEPR